MDSTPTFNLPYPEVDDLVMDGASAIQQLAAATEAALLEDPWTKPVAYTPVAGSSFAPEGDLAYWEFGRIAYIGGRVRATAAVAVPANGDVPSMTIAAINGPFGEPVTWRPIGPQALGSRNWGRPAHFSVDWSGTATTIILNSVGGSRNIAVNDSLSFGGIYLTKAPA